MLRTLWILISTLAIANLMALAVFLAWLNATDRLSTDRVQRIRELFAPTVAEEEEEAAETQRIAAAAAAAAEEQARIGKPPITAEERLAIIREHDEIARQRNERLQRETADLIQTLLTDRARFDRDKEDFRKQVEEWNAMRQQLAELEGSEQFQKTVAIFESIKAPEAMDMLSALIAEGDTDQAVAYLNAMKPRNSAKIIAEFEQKDSALAADLLERLRVYGLGTVDAEAGP